MKKLIAAVLLFSLLFAAIPAARADLMSEARSMLQMINDFRTGQDAWYWNRDNKTITKKTGLRRLQYGKELEATALVRAKELAKRFDHTRPDGTDCFTAFPAGRAYKAENIAYGYPTAKAAFNGFLEEDENYAGQGHRRVMLLDTVTRVGIAGVEIGGVRYWVQEFSSTPSASASSGKKGWVKRDGKWYYSKGDGSYITGWLKKSGKWYLMNDEGVMLTGWQKKDGKWYYLNSSGEMATGWKKINGKWYYLNKKSGERTTGWLKDGKKWYYLDKNGVMQTGWLKLDKTVYYLESSGARVTGWKTIKGAKYYFSSSGKMQTGWLKINKTWYYFHPSGKMATGTVEIDGAKEVFSSSGAWRYTQLKDYDTPLGTENVIVRIIRAVLQALRDLLRPE